MTVKFADMGCVPVSNSINYPRFAPLRFPDVEGHSVFLKASSESPLMLDISGHKHQVRAKVNLRRELHD